MVTLMIIVVNLTNTAKNIKAITIITRTMTYSNNENDDDDYGLTKPD